MRIAYAASVGPVPRPTATITPLNLVRMEDHHIRKKSEDEHKEQNHDAPHLQAPSHSVKRPAAPSLGGADSAAAHSHILLVLCSTEA